LRINRIDAFCLFIVGFASGILSYVGIEALMLILEMMRSIP